MPLIHQPPVSTSMSNMTWGGDEQAMDAARLNVMQAQYDAIRKTKQTIVDIQRQMVLVSCEQNSLQQPMAILCQNKSEKVAQETSICRKHINLKEPPFPAKQEAMASSKHFLNEQMPQAQTMETGMKPHALKLYPTAMIVVKTRTPVDVLLGRSTRNRWHIGNVAFRSLVDSRLDLYLRKTKRGGKINICIEVCQAVYDAGGRFFKPQDKACSSWKEVGVDVARARVTHAIRTARAKAGRLHRSGLGGHRSTKKFHESATFAEIVDYFVREEQNYYDQSDGNYLVREGQTDYDQRDLDYFVREGQQNCDQKEVGCDTKVKSGRTKC